LKKLSLVCCVLLIVCTVLPLFSCGVDDNTIVVCNWGQYMSTGLGIDASEDVVKLFTEKTGIKVKYVTFQTNEELYAKMKSDSAHYDVIVPSDYMVERMVKEGMLAKIDYTNIPNFKNIMDDFVNPYYDLKNEYTVPYFWGTMGIIYNKKFVSEEDLTGWEVLWNPKYSGNVMMMNNSRDAFAIAMLKLGYSFNSLDEKEIRAAAEELKKQNFDYKMDEFFERLPNEDAYMMPYYAGDYITVSEENENLEFFIPDEGTNLFNDAFCIPATSKKKELAEKFINFMLEPEIGLLNTEYVGYSTPNKEVFALLDDETKNDGISYPEIKDNWEHYICLPDETDDLLRELFIEVKGANN